MGQQPNIEIAEEERPRQALEPGPSVRWRSSKPGVPTSPDEVARGGAFGIAGPDPGWAWKVIDSFGLPDDDPRLRRVVGGLVMARAAALGRGAVAEDVEVALALCGFGEESSPGLVSRRERWLEASAHERRPGATAVAEVDLDLLVQHQDHVRRTVRAMG